MGMVRQLERRQPPLLPVTPTVHLRLLWSHPGRSVFGCPHVSKDGQLESLYTGCNPVFFYEGFVTCNDCIEVVPTASLYLQTLLECEAMTDDQLQDRVIDQLYPINRTTMEAVRHYKR
jgi:hypothetical protein